MSTQSLKDQINIFEFVLPLTSRLCTGKPGLSVSSAHETKDDNFLIFIHLVLRAACFDIFLDVALFHI